ncbi:MAG: sulfur carrier protein ThiS [Bacteroidaceae bacterium]|nr:sulfur carrier protein ThiS [Bacteroidaceae bacterium]
MKITVNDEQQEVREGLSISDLIKENDVAQPEMVSVQLNEEFVDRDDFDATILKDGDVVDFLYFMGGGTLTY